MRSGGRRILLAAGTAAVSTAALVFGGAVGAGAAPASGGDTGVLRTVARGASLTFPVGQKKGTPAGIQTPEFRRTEPDEGAHQDLAPNSLSPTGVPVVAPTAVSGAPGLTTSFMGLDGFDQRYANNGNQFSIEPPDQALCAGNGFVLEAVNDVLRVYQGSGQAASATTDLNSFYGYAAQFNRTTGKEGPAVTDPTCLFDHGTNRWFVTVLTLEVDPNTGAYLGPNHLDVAVSKTANPLGGYNIYRIPVQDDGTQGTPRHKDCPCIGDYPHIAADQSGFYVTTNEYPFTDAPGIYGNNFNGAQVYAVDKAALAAGAANANVVQFSRTQITQGGTTVPGFTLAPAQVPGTAYETANNGTEYFLSSIASEEAQPAGFTGQAQSLGVYFLTNTRSLSSGHPSLTLTGALRDSERYVNPPLATQKAGPVPLANYCTQVDCFGFGPGSYAEGPVATNDSRMLQVYYAHGLLYGGLNTGVQVADRLQSGIAWFMVSPGTVPLNSAVAHQGYIGVAGQNVMFPAVAALANGSGAMAYTLAGPGYFPTAAYSLVGPSGVIGAVHVAAAGVGPQDGFTEYVPQTDATSAPRPRWGDYGAAVPVGSAIWMASEYIGQSCNFAVYQRDPTCGNTRAPFLNWATRISSVTP